MSKARISYIAAGVPKRGRLANIEVGTDVPAARGRIARITLGVPSAPLLGNYTYVDPVTGWKRCDIYTYTGEGVQEGAAPSGWRRVTTDLA